MHLLNGINHLTFLTADMDRLIDFYQRVFDAHVTLDLIEFLTAEMTQQYLSKLNSTFR